MSAFSAVMDSLGEPDELARLFAHEEGVEVLGRSVNSGYSEVRIGADSVSALIQRAAAVCGTSLPAGDDLLVEPAGGEPFWTAW